MLGSVNPTETNYASTTYRIPFVILCQTTKNLSALSYSTEIFHLIKFVLKYIGNNVIS